MKAMTRETERKLIERAGRGDRAAAAKLIQAHQRSLYAYLLRLSGKPEMAEDIAQDAFVRVLSHIDRFDTRFRFSTWVFTIAKRLYVNANQKMKPHYDSEIVGAQRGDGSLPMDPSIDGEHRDRSRDAVQEALATLSETQRDVFLLFHQQEWPIALIASQCGMPEGTVKSHLHRARQKMRAHLRESERHQSVLQEAGL
jgi:RNA polymerase sigma-70 factor (ECF subfamily)